MRKPKQDSNTRKAMIQGVARYILGIYFTQKYEGLNTQTNQEAKRKQVRVIMAHQGDNQWQDMGGGETRTKTKHMWQCKQMLSNAEMSTIVLCAAMHTDNCGLQCSAQAENI